MILFFVHCHPLKGKYKTLNNVVYNDKKLDVYGVVALAKRLNISIDEMKDMSFVSLVNILISTVESKDSSSRMATQSDINKFF